MTFEKALSKVNEMTEAEKDALECLLLESDAKEDGRRLELIVLELDAETQAPTDHIYCISVQQNTLPEGVYETGKKLLFNVNGEEILCQVLEVNMFDISGTAAAGTRGA